MLKIYEINGKQWQFEEGEQPVGAVEVKPETEKAKKPPEEKAAAPSNKSRKAANK